jgi:hypothetical protein
MIHSSLCKVKLSNLLYKANEENCSFFMKLLRVNPGESLVRNSPALLSSLSFSVSIMFSFSSIFENLAVSR